MSKLLTGWNDLETVGSKGRAFKQTKDYTRMLSQPAMKYASLIGLGLSIFTLVMAVV